MVDKMNKEKVNKKSKEKKELDRYERIVDRAHNEIKGVRSVYVWLIGTIGVVVAVGGFITYDSVSDFRSELSDLRKEVKTRVDAELSTEPIQRLIREGVSDQVDRIAKILIREVIEREVGSQIKIIETKLSNLDDKLEENKGALELISELYLTIIGARGDDRKAYDKLKNWGQDESYVHSDLAFDTCKTIAGEYVGSLFVPYMLYSDPNVFSNLSFSELSEGYHQVSKWYHADFVVQINKRNDFPEKKRLEFLIDVLQNDESLTAVHYAGKVIAKKAGLAWNPFNIQPLIKWWEENRENYDKNQEDKPTEPPDKK